MLVKALAASLPTALHTYPAVLACFAPSWLRDWRAIFCTAAITAVSLKLLWLRPVLLRTNPAASLILSLPSTFSAMPPSPRRFCGIVVGVPRHPQLQLLEPDPEPSQEPRNQEGKQTRRNHRQSPCPLIRHTLSAHPLQFRLLLRKELCLLARMQPVTFGTVNALETKCAERFYASRP